MVDFTNPTTRNNTADPTLRVNASTQENLLRTNKLHKFASYNYVLTLSGIDRGQIADPENIPTDQLHDIIARTGGIGINNPTRNYAGTKGVSGKTGDAIGAEEVNSNKLNTKQKQSIAQSRAILIQNRDLYFNSVVINSVARPNEERKLMNFTKIEMNLEEPNGITFWEKCRAAAYNCGYVNHVNAPFLITIEFKGYDSNGKMVPSGIPRRAYPVKLVNSSLSMGAGGTTYSVTAVPWTEFGMQNAFLYTRSKVTATAGLRSLSDQLRLLADDLVKEQVDNEVKLKLREHPDKYIITADPDIGLIQSPDGTNEYPMSGFLKNPARLNRIELNKNTSIVQGLIDYIRQFDKYAKIDDIILKKVNSYSDKGGGRIAEDDQFVDWFKIITSVDPGGEFDNILKTETRTIRFHVKSFKLHILNFVRAGFGYTFDYRKAIKKQFDYIYTGNNLDILDLSVDYNASYYQAILRDSTARQNVFKRTVEKIKNLVGTKTFENDPLLPLHKYITTLKSGKASVHGNDPSNEEADLQYDYLVNPRGDMVQVEMKIMGDPDFLGQDYAIPMKLEQSSEVRAAIGRNLYDEKAGCYNFDNGEVIVGLNFKFPADFDEGTGLYVFQKENTPQFTGLYRIIQVESRLENGQFTQVLNMVRCNGQQQVTSSIRKIVERDNVHLERIEKVFTGGEAGTAGTLGAETEIE